MNNEAITTAADHRAPPARPTLPDLGGGGARAFPSTASLLPAAPLQEHGLLALALH